MKRKKTMISHFKFTKQDMDGLCIIEPFFCNDERGFFSKSYEKDLFLENGISTDIQEEFESLSKKGVIRGLHFQSKNPQSKMVKVLSGEIYDVALDLRKDSETFGQWRGYYLSGENMKTLYVPSGFAHGFLTISDTAHVSYRCTGKYLKDYDAGIRWDDPDIGICWPYDRVKDIIVSERDKGLISFREYKNAK